MNNQTTKKLIVLGSIIFSLFFVASDTFAYSCLGYSCESYNYNQTDQGYSTYYYTDNIVPVPYVPNNTTTTKTNPAVINNYYYQNETTPNNTTTVNEKNNSYNPTQNNSSINKGQQIEEDYYRNNLGASAYNSYDQSYSRSQGNEITALSLRGSGGFMPSSIWQWIFVVILILVIVILGRMFVHKPSPHDN